MEREAVGTTKGKSRERIFRSNVLLLIIGLHVQGIHKRMVRFQKVNKEFISHFSRAQLTPSAAETVQVSHALPAVSFSCLMRGCGASFQDGVAAGRGFLCAPF